MIKTSTKVAAGLLGAGAALATLNWALSKHAERPHPPAGEFIEVDGVQLHYSDRGKGPTVVLIHGAVVTGDDWNTSGVATALLRSYRVIIFDRPGYGHSTRPRRMLPWTGARQAHLIARALRRLDVERPVVVGHSWGTIVALAMATGENIGVAGLVLVSGYYRPTLRPDVLLVAPAAMPLIGNMLRHTISPLFARLTMPLLKKALFWPASLGERFAAQFSTELAVRPSQLGAIAADSTLMIPSVFGRAGSYVALDVPVSIVAGAGDLVVFKRMAKWLHSRIQGSELHIVDGAGHMVHHTAPLVVTRAVERVVTEAAEFVRLAA